MAGANTSPMVSDHGHGAEAQSLREAPTRATAGGAQSPEVKEGIPHPPMPQGTTNGQYHIIAGKAMAVGK
eukprot:9767739-Karenia_brevis.AAC.1